MRTIIWFAYFWLYLIALIPKLKKAQKLKRKGEIEQCSKMVLPAVTTWANRLLKLAGANVTVIGKENLPSKPVVYVANHQGYFDIPLMLACLDKPNRLIAKIETKKIPLIRDWMEILDCVFIDRSNAKQSVTALNDAADSLVENGKSFIIFPEGTRSDGENVREFKNGAFKIATKAKAAIVPVVIDGSYRLLEGNNMRIKPADVTVKILQPIETAGKTREEIKNLAVEIRQLITEAKNGNVR